ncbi:hypothetical protein BGW38_001443 [Lunasporangiospora selenospora]|uniref:Uncharacterized protein n=1 Tax=Lunasporangiospora selenospora TaxID=979761 RepID=A0A9P6FU62_9FUNG|nr:hypothetical protein BGW38_001443 [Lunasporangiospora selenospora]
MKMRKTPKESGNTFEYICDDDTTVYTANSFEITIYQCMYQRKHQKTHFNADEQEFREFEVRSPRSQPTSPSSSGSSRVQRRTNSPSNDRKVSVKSEPGIKINLPSLPQLLERHECLAEAYGTLGLFDSRTGLFNDSAEGFIRVVRTSSENYWLIVIDTSERQLLAQPFSRSMTPVFTPAKLSLIWAFDDTAGKYTWIFRFADLGPLKNVQLKLGECMVETLRCADAAEAQKQRQAQAVEHAQAQAVKRAQAQATERAQALEREQPKFRTAPRAGSSAQGQLKYEERSEEEQDSGSEEEAEESDDDDDFMVSSGSQQDGQKNSHLAVGFKDRSFVVRGSKIGVFSHDREDGRLKFETTITNLNGLSRGTVKPSRILLHDADASMMMIDEDDGDTVYKMDLEYGKIVEEWNLPGTTGVKNLIPNSKYSQQSGEQTLIGHSKEAMFRIDPRLAGSKIVAKDFKQYAKGNHFTCGTTTTNGSLAVAGAKGDIKLFNIMGKNAKTALPGLGEPITGIDVTGSGQYLLATTASYLLVIDVLNPGNKSLGFDRSFPIDSKPDPIKLTLRPEHVAAMRHRVNFTPARFNTGIGEEEKTIVTSTGPYVITWNFRRVKLGYKDYQIKQYDDNVVADNFKYGQDRSIIVALPHDVTSVQKKNMVNSETF